MTEVVFSASFKRAFKKHIEGRKLLEEKFWRCMDTFRVDPHDERLRVHKLSGKLHELWSFTVAYDTRVVFCFLPSNRAMFVDIGTHDEVY